MQSISSEETEVISLLMKNKESTPIYMQMQKAEKKNLKVKENLKIWWRVENVLHIGSCAIIVAEFTNK